MIKKETPSFSAKGSKTKENHEAKKVINIIFARETKKHLQKIILDAAGICTTKALIKRGHNPDTIHIPNSNKDEYKLITRKHKNTYFITIGEFLYNNRNNKVKVGGIHLDYMCTFDFSGYCEPKKDLAIIFNNKMLVYGGVLGITLSPRSNKNGSPFEWIDIGRLFNFINLLALANGYTIEVLDVGGTYNNGGPMYTYMFKVHKK